jgi:DNA-binding NarL/FixJ family response regulator
MKPLTSICLVDDHENTLVLWQRRLTAAAGFRCAAVFTDAESALPFLLAPPPAVPPALLLVDWRLPGMDGLTLIACVKAAHPKICTVLITNHNTDELPLAAVRTGVDGCLLKTDSPATLPARLREVMSGTNVYSSRLMQRLTAQLRNEPVGGAAIPDPLAILTPREREVFREFARGQTCKEVAARLHISVTTVKTHKEHVLAKLDVQNITEASARYGRFLA